jgi:hypothetical protein
MGTDISHIPLDNLLTTLGKGDWLLTMPNSYPDLPVTAAWRQALRDDIACWFVRWVLNGILVEITYDCDPPWDCSGHVRCSHVDPAVLRTRYATLDDWLTDAYTGNSTATYDADCGLHWNTYEKNIEWEIGSRVSALIVEHLVPVVGHPEASDDLFDMWEDIWHDVDNVERALEYALRVSVGEMATADAWRGYEAVVRARLEQELRQQAEHAAQIAIMRDQTRAFWQQHFPDLVGSRIEMPEFRRLKLLRRLTELIADTDPEIVRAILEVGFPADFSGSMGDQITEIARAALDEPGFRL